MSKAATRKATTHTPESDLLRRELVTPEGIDLRIELASAGDRAAAFLLDGLIIVAALVVLTIACTLVAVATKGDAMTALAIVWLLGFFVLRNGWFLAFEMGPRAATPGKRKFGLRVAARSGGALKADAILARNAMREIEVFLPLTFLALTPSGSDGWMKLLGLLWSGVFALFPLFNRDKLRVGDLVAGTWVVKDPRRKLVVDLTHSRPTGQDGRFSFTPAQLDVYGVKELQVLEDVLRQNQRAAIRAVAKRIRANTGWAERPDETDSSFLDAYYAALRARLESRLLLGRRRKDKHDAP